MNIRSPFNPTQIGEWLAHCDDQQQAEMFNAFSKELYIACKADSEMQLCYTSKHLSPSAEKMIEALWDFIKIRKEEK